MWILDYPNVSYQLYIILLYIGTYASEVNYGNFYSVRRAIEQIQFEYKYLKSVPRQRACNKFLKKK